MDTFEDAGMFDWAQLHTLVDGLPALELNEHDFLASFEGARVLIEEETKADDPEYLARRGEHLSTGDIHAHSISLRRSETLSGVVRNASKQLAVDASRKLTSKAG